MTDKNIQVASEIAELLALADKKGLASITDTNQRLARLSAVLAYQEIYDATLSSSHPFWGLFLSHLLPSNDAIERWQHHQR